MAYPIVSVEVVRAPFSIFEYRAEDGTPVACSLPFVAAGTAAIELDSPDKCGARSMALCSVTFLTDGATLTLRRMDKPEPFAVAATWVELPTDRH